MTKLKIPSCHLYEKKIKKTELYRIKTRHRLTNRVMAVDG